MNGLLRPGLVLLFGVAMAATLHGQAAPPTAFDKDEKTFQTKAAQTLMTFAGYARSNKVLTKEKEAYDLIVTRYDPEHSQARSLLGWNKEKGEWKAPPPKKRKEWVDKASDKQRYDVIGKWAETAKSLGKQHRDRGLKLIDSATGSEVVEGTAHLRQAILYDPFDREAHLALGHEEKDGYFGTPEELAFIGSMRSIETFALTLAKKQYESKPVETLPDELKNTGLEFHGARSANFTIFTRGTQANADDLVQWGERAVDFFEHLAGPQRAKGCRRVLTAWTWRAFLWTEKEREKFLEVNPTLAPKEGQQQTANIAWTQGNKNCEVSIKLTPASMHDSLIASVFKYGFGEVNSGLSEGVIHAATWFLKSTCFTRFGAQPEGTVGEADLELPDGANWWLREMRDQARAGTDTPINVVPRVPLWKFDNDSRLKSWSFMVWAMARFPQKWVEWLREVPHEKVPFPEEVDAVALKVFGRPLAEVEVEWREWASGRGVAAAATGYGPPLLPEKPDADEIEGLSRLNALRRLAKPLPPPVRNSGPKKADDSKKTVAKGENEGLPLCDLDAEATMACKLHAAFLGRHEEHHTWPEAHEEDPAKEGFTPAGMRAGLRSVIVWGDEVDASDSVDMWIGTVYHRFPLLEYNINRIGFGHMTGDKADVIVLDMGSLEEPHNAEHDEKFALVPWPPDKMTNVPRVFAYTEHPNPLEDVGLTFEDQRGTGYPVSVQMADWVAKQVTGGALELFEAKKRAGVYEAGDKVPCWEHTPDAPLLKRLELRDVFFVIPKQHLAANKTYLAVCRIEGVGRELTWTFTTGTEQHGLGAR